ncbi:MAG: hypothetical protein ABSD92_08315 [Candidatus Bathyarchaeia archaeon]|jgi:hypothetical protein
MEDLKHELRLYGYTLKVTGGLKERGFTSHDVDLDISMPTSEPPDEEIFRIINAYGNELWNKCHLDFDLNFCYKRKLRYKLDKESFFEYQEDGSLERFSPL